MMNYNLRIILIGDCAVGKTAYATKLRFGNYKNNNLISQLYIIWDFDAAIGQINSTYPYNYHEELLYKEIENVEKILKYVFDRKVPMIFAITGFSAEKGIFPFHFRDLIRKIYF